MRVGQAGAHALAAEAVHLEELIGAALSKANEIAAAADSLARLDVVSALAERAVEGGWCRPHFAPHSCLGVEAGRAPVVEDAFRVCGESFLDIACGSTGRASSRVRGCLDVSMPLVAG